MVSIEEKLCSHRPAVLALAALSVSIEKERRSEEGEELLNNDLIAWADIKKVS